MLHKSLLGLALGLAVGVSAQAADVRVGLISYWPLDALIEGDTQTPDVVSTNNMTAVNFTATEVVAGQRGNAFSFGGGADGDPAARYLFWLDQDPNTGLSYGNGLPVANLPAMTVAYWVKGKGTGQNDKKMFAMSSSISTDPLFSFGTHSTGANDSFDLYVRNGGNPVNHFRAGTPFDDTWRHVVWTDNNGQGLLYVDGVLVTNLNYTRPPTPLAYEIASIGAVYRPSTTVPQQVFTGLIDDVAVWERVLSPEEVQEVFASGIVTPVPKFAPSLTRQPNSTSRLVGDSVTFTVAVVGTRPFTEFQWFKGTQPIQDATETSLGLTVLQQSDSGDYSFVARNNFGSVTSVVATLTVNAIPPPDLLNGMVAYWPLDAVEGTKTVDLANGYDMNLVNMTATNVVPGRWGNAFMFYAASGAMLERENQPDDKISIYPKATNFTVSIWVNGPPNQQDKRIFSESSTTSTQPLFNLGTHNTAADGALNTYIRNDTGGQGGHRPTALQAYDDTWHHVVYVQRVLDGTMIGRVYVDGVLDEGTTQPIPQRPLSAVVTSIGGVRRGLSTAPNRSFPFQGMIDDVAIWERALNEPEIALLFQNGTPIPTGNVQPLAINSFTADLPAVGVNDSVTLRWDVSKDVTALTIDQGVGNVLPQTSVGLGSTTVAIDTSKTFTIIATRGEESLTNTVTVAAIGGIAANWALLDNFDRYPAGPFLNNGYWSDTRTASITNVNGNPMLDLIGVDQTVILQLNNLAIPENAARTLFTRVFVARDPGLSLSNYVGVSDRSLRFQGDEVDGGGFGPQVTATSFDGFSYLGTRNGPFALNETVEPPLQLGEIYNIWIDITNGTLVADADTGDYFTVHVQREGDATRTVLFQDYYSNRSPSGDPAGAGGSPARAILDKLAVGNDLASNSLLFDDFYISKSGYNPTIPRPVGFTVPLGQQQEPPTLSIGRNGNQVRLIWANGTLLSAPTVNGGFLPVEGATSPYDVTPTGERYYRVRQ